MLASEHISFKVLYTLLIKSIDNLDSFLTKIYSLSCRYNLSSNILFLLSIYYFDLVNIPFVLSLSGFFIIILSSIL